MKHLTRKIIEMKEFSCLIIILFISTSEFNLAKAYVSGGIDRSQQNNTPAYRYYQLYCVIISFEISD